MWNRAGLTAALVFVLGWATTLPIGANPAPNVPQALSVASPILPPPLDWSEALKRAQEVHRRDVMNRSIDRVLSHEGGFANRSRDPGGPTRFGITKRTARMFGYVGRMDALSPELARFIYEQIWTMSGAGNIGSDEFAFQAFDAYVNHGPRSVGWVKTATATAGDYARACRRLNDMREAAYRQSANWATFGKGWLERLRKNRQECV